MDKIYRLSEADAEDFFRGLFDGWEGTGNVSCPFAASRHGKGMDRNPSMSLYPDTGGAHCHACGYHAKGPDNLYADMKGIPLARARRVLWGRYVEPLVPDEAWKEPARALLMSPLVVKRLLKYRGLTRETAMKYHLGYDGKRLTIPVFNEEGYCVNIRRYDLFKESNGPKIVSWKHGYGKARIYPDMPAGGDVFLVEGELDALIGRQVGIPTVTTTGGASLWNNEWNRLFSGKNVAIIPDDDDAGKRGAELRCRGLASSARSARIAALPRPPRGKDLTEWVQNGGTISKILELARGPEGAGTSPATGSSTRGESRLDWKAGADENKLVDRAVSVWTLLASEGRFFRNSEGDLFYVQENKEPIRVTDAPGPFMAMLTRMSPLINQATVTGKFVYKYLQNNTFAWGDMSKTGVFSLYDSGALYVHAGEGKITRIKDEVYSTIKNAVNEDHVLLDVPTKGMSIHAQSNSMPADGLAHLRELFLDNLPVCDEDRYFLLAWLAGLFLRDYIRPKPIVRLLASTASGKSTMSKLFSVLLYGEELLSHSASTIAATYEMSNRFPLLILDNMETANMTPELTDFLLIAATGGMRVKRKAATDRGLVMERTDCLVLTNGIEPFNRHELIDRTVEIGLDIKKWGQVGFHEARVFEELKEHRQKIMGSILYLLSRYVLPRVAKGEIKRIIGEFGPHGKERFNEYLALMSLILDALWGYMPLESYGRPHDLVSYWLDSQTRANAAQDVGTDDVLYYLNTLHDKHAQLMGASLTFSSGRDGTRLVCTTRELLTDFRVLARFLGTRCPWTNERQLGTRLADSEKTLNKAGWEREKRRVRGKDEYVYTRRSK